MELGEEGMTFHPSLEVGEEHGFLALIESLINDIYNAAKLIPRLAKGRLNYKVSRGSLRPTRLACLGSGLIPGSEWPSGPSSAWLSTFEVMVAWNVTRAQGFLSPGRQTGSLSLLPQSRAASQSGFSSLGLAFSPRRLPTPTGHLECSPPRSWCFPPFRNVSSETVHTGHFATCTSPAPASVGSRCRP